MSDGIWVNSTPPERMLEEIGQKNLTNTMLGVAIERLVEWAHEALTGADLVAFYERAPGLLGLSPLQTLAMEAAASATRYMQYERLEWEDYGIIADHVERLGVLSALGVLPPLPHQRELLDGLAAFVEKRHHRGRLREELDRVRSAHPLWSQPFCLQLLEIAFGRG
jgi:hypothetical protein